jgi:hypothetical protein
MKLNSILKLSSLGLVSLGLVSTVALTTTSCSDVVSEITLTGDFKQGAFSELATANVKIKDLILLIANNKASTTVTDEASRDTFDNESADTSVDVMGSMDAETGGYTYVVSIDADAEVKSYELKGYYMYGKDTEDEDKANIKYHAVTVKLTVTAA